jgi:SSS family solute:Na+ symporter/sodium/pantothenate symporter
MAFRDTKTLRQALFLLGIYNTLIYLPLILIFVCAKSFVTELKSPDEAMPAVALAVASPWVAGIILAAPFGAVMATVSGYLVQISSSIVQDVYHRINPNASERTLRRLSHSGIILVAVIASAATMKKIDFLQAIIVFAGGAAACAYLVPALMAAFWRRATAAGALAALLGGSMTVVALYVLPWIGVASNADPGMGEKSSMYPIYLFGMTPFVWGMLVSVVCGIAFSLATPPMKEEDVAPLF